MKYRPEIDGLRALAVIPVLLFHAGVPGFAGGFVGVDVFFVISGYLITSIILHDLRSGTFSIGKFYERRARRILPALFAVIAACVPVALWVAEPAEVRGFSKSVVAVCLFVSNFFFWMEEDYFAPAAEEQPLLHTWSLAVEEQYYVVFPVAMALLWRFGTRVSVAVWVGVALASAGLAQWMSEAAPSANFYLPFGRAWELLVGSLAAFALRGEARRGHDGLAGVGLAALGASLVLIDRGTPFPSWWTGLPVFGTAALVLGAGTGSRVGALLGARPLVAIGLVSYSAYLWHQPVLAFARLHAVDGPPSWSANLAWLAVSLVLAAASWKFVEGPFRSPDGPFRTRRSVFTASGLGLAGFAALAVVGWRSDLASALWEARVSSTTVRTAALQAAAKKRMPDKDADRCRFYRSAIDDQTRARLAECASAHGPGVALVGDSHAADLFGAVLANEPPPFVFGLTGSYCTPALDEAACARAWTDLAAIVGEGSPFRRVVYHQAGFQLFGGEGDGPGERRMFRDLPMSSPVPPFPVLASHLDANARYLEGLAARVEVSWLGPRIEPHVPRKYVLHHGCDASFPLRGGQAERFEALEDAIAERLRGSEVRYVSAIDALAYDPRADFTTCEALFWSDGDHWSRVGQERFGARLRPALGW